MFWSQKAVSFVWWLFRVYKADFTQVYRNPDVYIDVKGFTEAYAYLTRITAIYSWAEYYCLCGMPIFTYRNVYTHS